MCTRFTVSTLNHLIHTCLRERPGLENIHQLTSSGAYTLRVDLEDWEGNQRYAEYSSFSVGSAAFGYRLDACYGYSGNAGQ